MPTLVHIIGFVLLLAARIARSQDVVWQYPESGQTFNYNDVIVASWHSEYEYPTFFVWAPNSDGSAIIEYTSDSSVWSNGSFAYTFSSARGGHTTYPFTAHFQLSNSSTPSSNASIDDDGNIFTITSTSGAPTTYAYSSTTTVSQAESTPTNTAGPQSISDFAYVGCWTDAIYDRTLRNSFIPPTSLGGLGNVTLENCFEACTATPAAVQAGYTIIGVEYGTQCFCDTVIFNPAAYAVPERECNSPCAGDSSANCGGTDRLDMYAISGSLPAWSASVTPSVTSPVATGAAGTVALIPASTTAATSTDATGSTVTSPASTATPTSTATATTTPAANTDTNTASSTLSTGAKVGIGIAAAVIVILAVLAVVWFMRRRQRRPKYKAGPFAGHHSGEEETLDVKSDQRLLSGVSEQQTHPSELSGQSQYLELGGGGRHELSAEVPPRELETPYKKM